MLSEDITTDQILTEINEQIELLEAMADRNVILAELLRVMREAKALIKSQTLQIQRLEELEKRGQKKGVRLTYPWKKGVRLT